MVQQTIADYRLQFPVLLDTAGIFERSNPQLPENPVFPYLNRNTAYISLIYNNQVLFARQFDTVKFPQSYNIQK